MKLLRSWYSVEVPLDAVYVTAMMLPNAEIAIHILRPVAAPNTFGANFSATARSEWLSVRSS